MLTIFKEAKVEVRKARALMTHVNSQCALGLNFILVDGGWGRGGGCAIRVEFKSGKTNDAPTIEDKVMLALAKGVSLKTPPNHLKRTVESML